MNTVVTDSTHDRVELNHISRQSGHDGGRAIDISVSYLNHGGRGGTDFCNKSVTIDDSSSKIHAACRGKSSPLKTGPIILCTIKCLISCEPACCRKICKESYMSSDLRDNRTLIAGENSNSSIVGSVGRIYKNLNKRLFHFYGSRRSFFLQWHQLNNTFWLIKNVGLDKNCRLWTCVILCSLAC